MSAFSLAYKAFIIGKDGEADGRQDRLAMRPGTGLFAVADGVSNSFHPEWVAQAMCQAFVDGAPADAALWPEFISQQLYPYVAHEWQAKVDAHLQGLTGRLMRHEMYAYERWRAGAATFCGVRVDLDAAALHFAVIGDATAYIAPADGPVVKITTAPCADGVVNYSCYTYAMLSNNASASQWCCGTLPLAPGFVMLMTDGMAAWAQKQQLLGNNPADTVWALADTDAFLQLVAQAHAQGDMDDDLAVVIIKVDADAESGSQAPDNDTDDTDDDCFAAI